MAKYTPEIILKKFNENEKAQKLFERTCSIKPVIQVGHKRIYGKEELESICPYCKKTLKYEFKPDVCPECGGVFNATGCPNILIEWNRDSDHSYVRAYSDSLTGVIDTEEETAFIQGDIEVNTDNLPDVELKLNIKALAILNKTTKDKALFVKYSGHVDFSSTKKRIDSIFPRYSGGLHFLIKEDGKTLEGSYARGETRGMIDTFLHIKKEPKRTATRRTPKIEAPEILQEAPPLVPVTEIKKISSTVKLTDYTNKTETFENKCLFCGHTWEETRPQYTSGTFVCPSCGAECAGRNRHIRVIYVSISESRTIAQLVEYYCYNEREVKARRLEAFEVQKCGKCIIYDIDTSGTASVTQKRSLSERGYVNSVDILDVEGKDTTGVLSLVESGHRTAWESLFKFLKLSTKYPIVEKLAKAGLVSEFFYYTEDFDPLLNFEAEDIYSALGVTKEIINKYKENSDMTPYNLKRIKRAREAYPDAPIDFLFYVEKREVELLYVKEIMTLLPSMSYKDIQRYLERVRLIQMYQPRVAVREWRDYLKAAKSIGMDMTDRHVLYPRALKTEHDIVVAKARFIADEATIEKFNEAVKKYKHLEYHKGEYFIRVPASTAEMLEEGRKLRHCCGQYIDDVAEGNAFVVFLRKEKEPDTPFLSMEITPTGEIKQVRGLNDTPAGHLPEGLEVNTFLLAFAKKNDLNIVLI